uniref:(northern house mosquito) hypothetical protein n=1 Tax=Culex pipiens TaxID=7175 RepID=A0A8D8F7Y5_CULPI
MPVLVLFVLFALFAVLVFRLVLFLVLMFVLLLLLFRLDSVRVFLVFGGCDQRIAGKRLQHVGVGSGQRRCRSNRRWRQQAADRRRSVHIRSLCFNVDRVRDRDHRPTSTGLVRRYTAEYSELAVLLQTLL